MNPWTQMWLNYFPRATKGNEAYFEKYRLDETEFAFAFRLVPQC